jgi:Ni/Fe-hydrogenase subunit HybB-like protein
LPLLFLLSAFAAGYPMVTFESIIVAKSFNRRPEMEILTPLARFMPLLMGIYLVFKIGDMIIRGTYVYLLDGTYQTNAFVVEVLFGAGRDFYHHSADRHPDVPLPGVCFHISGVGS